MAATGTSSAAACIFRSLGGRRHPRLFGGFRFGGQTRLLSSLRGCSDTRLFSRFRCNGKTGVVGRFCLGSGTRRFGGLRFGCERFRSQTRLLRSLGCSGSAPLFRSLRGRAGLFGGFGCSGDPFVVCGLGFTRETRHLGRFGVNGKTGLRHGAG